MNTSLLLSRPPCLSEHISEETFNKLSSLGFEHDEGTGGLHFMVMLGRQSGIGFDLWPEEDGEWTLYFGEFDYKNNGEDEEPDMRAEEFAPMRVDIDSIEKMVMPYINRAAALY